ncbi:MAG: hypothetical protein CPDRYMAC_0259 [uncultured Paraburkholderia sp.]|nr:MAG: hypothetical protein CPDRYDRY_6549 [uncultured Paraburkholderia sp.]CAH2910664.1 MAG: hypothetical protein CPDRYMAC_0259 [uncultured Paraburkholderia sp.]
MSASFVSVAGRPAMSPRLIAGLLYLQHALDLSDEEVVWEGRPRPQRRINGIQRACIPRNLLFQRAYTFHA